MLVLTRAVKETLTITVPPSDKPTVVTITLIDVRWGKARLGFEAPCEVQIWRTELLGKAVEQA